MGNIFIFIKLILKRIFLSFLKIFLLFFVLFFLFCSLSSVFADDKPLKIHFIDVGEGDSIFIEAPNGKAALIDAGNLISGFRVTKYLKKNAIKNLEYLIFTHPHLDHIGGAFFVLQMFEVRNIYDTGEDLSVLSRSSDIYRWYEKLTRKRKNYRILKAGDKLSLGEVKLKVLWPPHPFALSDFNGNSLVIMLKYNRFSCLLTGDLNSVAEKKLLDGDIILKADVLKVGHHGAKDASSEEFLNIISPCIAIISVNAENVRGYPSEAALKRLKKVGSQIYRTDKNGDIVLIISSEGEFKIEKK